MVRRGTIAVARLILNVGLESMGLTGGRGYRDPASRRRLIVANLTHKSLVRYLDATRANNPSTPKPT